LRLKISAFLRNFSGFTIQQNLYLYTLNLFTKNMMTANDSAQSITFEVAKGYTLNWEAYQAHELWLKGFLIPRPNLLHLFLEAEEEAIEITLGVKKAVGPMISKENPQPGDVFSNRVTVCPPYCTPETSL
jgi:hypothetical protein